MKNKVQESLLSALYEVRQKIKGASKEELPVIVEALEDITAVIVKLDGISIWEKSVTK